MASFNATSSLKVPSDSLTIGPIHKKVLREKRDQLERELSQKRAELEGRESRLAGTPSRSATADSPAAVPRDERVGSQEELNKLREKYQATLEQLYERFQKEWMADPREIDLKAEPPDARDGQYLAQAVGMALATALAEVCHQKPPDPIEYLALLLRKHAENTERAHEEAVFELKKRLAKEELLMSVDQSNQMTREKAHIKQEEDRRKEIFMKSSPRPEDKASDGGGQPGDSEADSQTSSSVQADTQEEAAKLYTIKE